MVNQAALKAATERAMRVTMKHLDEARDRILMGPARLKGLHADEEANRNTGKFMIVLNFIFFKKLIMRPVIQLLEYLQNILIQFIKLQLLHAENHLDL